MQYSYTVIFQPLAEGGFMVHVPAMPEIVTYGRTREVARAMAEDAIRCVLESAQNAGEPFPEDITSAAERLAISMPNS